MWCPLEARPESHVNPDMSHSCKHGQGVALRQETDVLDAWFSSGLWRFSTQGWPNEASEMG